MVLGTCPLCQTSGVELEKSHMMPAALYGKRNKDYELTTINGSSMTQEQMRQPLLCGKCEDRFDQNGESHVLKVIAPKAGKRFPLADRMSVAFPRDFDGQLCRFYAPDFDIDVVQFTYFAVSVVWRATQTQWMMPDGTMTQKQELGAFQENMRRYLTGETFFPSDMGVIVIVSSDEESRRRFFHPAGFVEGRCINFRFVARGICFRVMMGYQMWPALREASCTSPLRPIWFGNCEKQLERCKVITKRQDAA